MANTIIKMMKRLLPLSFIALGTLVILGVLISFYRSGNVNASRALELPQQIAGVRLSDLTIGDEAIKDVAQMHGKEFPVVDGAIAEYGNRKLTLWISEAPTNEIALQMTNAMHKKIAQGNSPFVPLEESKDNDRTVYVLEGMGQKHFYFKSENRVIWLAADPAIAKEALKQILEVYP